MARDPVCGMQVDEFEPGIQFLLEERTYWFCSEACLAEFQRHPDEYAGPSADDEPGGLDV